MTTGLAGGGGERVQQQPQTPARLGGIGPLSWPTRSSARDLAMDPQTTNHTGDGLLNARHVLLIVASTPDLGCTPGAHVVN
jgi:hypothetical protein